MMTQIEDDIEEPSDGGQLLATAPKPKGSRQSFGDVRRTLTEEELANPGTQKMLLDEIDRLDDELVQARTKVAEFHTADKRVAVLEEKLKPKNALEVMSTGLVTVGSLICGATYSSLGSTAPEYGLFLLGVVLVICGVGAKAIVK